MLLLRLGIPLPVSIIRLLIRVLAVSVIRLLIRVLTVSVIRLLIRFLAVFRNSAADMRSGRFRNSAADSCPAHFRNSAAATRSAGSDTFSYLHRMFWVSRSCSIHSDCSVVHPLSVSPCSLYACCFILRPIIFESAANCSNVSASPRIVTGTPSSSILS